jgi:hypothetical protein
LRRHFLLTKPGNSQLQQQARSIVANRQIVPPCFGSAAKANYTQFKKIRPGGNEHMRKLCSFVIAIGVTLSPMAWADPLAPGKPAGVHKAQMTGREWAVFGGIAALGIGIAIATAGGRSSNAQNQSISVVTTNP